MEGVISDHLLVLLLVSMAQLLNILLQCLVFSEICLKAAHISNNPEKVRM